MSPSVRNGQRHTVLPLITIAFAALILLYPHASQSVPFTYDEAVQGDIAPSPEVVFPLDVGVNTVTGSVTFSNIDRGTDFDAFFINIPEGALLHSASLRQTLGDGTGILDRVGWLLSDVQTGRQKFLFVSPKDSVQQPFSDVLPAGPGRYILGAVSLGGSIVGVNEFKSADYTWGLVVEPCPASGCPNGLSVAEPPPTTLLVFLLAALCRGGLRHTRAHLGERSFVGEMSRCDARSECVKA